MTTKKAATRKTPANKTAARKAPTRRRPQTAASSILGTLSASERTAAKKRIAALRRAHPGATIDDLLPGIIRNKCMQAGAVGALAALGRAVPGLATVQKVAFGTAMDAALTAKLQAELVHEIFALYRLRLSSDEERALLLLVATLSSGTVKAAEKAANAFAAKLARKYGGALLERVLPVAGILSHSAANVLATYAVAKRAQTIARLRDPESGDVSDLLRGITGIDESKLIDWTRQGVDMALLPLKKGLGGALTLARFADKVVRATPVGKKSASKRRE
ncbi:MAG TPA: hypothetical protein PKZ76_02270 [Xanthomonadaceae bacterium]|nr:hypothetical protein [Xanthomonadaceae bacterium]